MSNETKRDVFEQLLNEHQNLISKDNGMLINITTPLNIMYDDALPDDLPVIPKAVGVHIRWCKSNTGIKAGIRNLLDALELPDWAGLEAEYWINDNPEMFARAWLLGVWRVEETEEIVKLEEIDDGN